jgi:hypothetical protein
MQISLKRKKHYSPPIIAAFDHYGAWLLPLMMAT